MESSVLYFSSSVCHFHPDNNILLFTQWYTLLCLAGKNEKQKRKKNGIMSRQEHHAQRAINKTGSTHHCSDFFKSTACLPSTAAANFATFSPDLATFWEPFSDWTSNKGQATNLVTISVGISYFLAPTQSSPDHISRRLWSWLKHELPLQNQLLLILRNIMVCYLWALFMTWFHREITAQYTANTV